MSLFKRAGNVSSMSRKVVVEEPDNRTHELVERFSAELDRLVAVTNQLQQTVSIYNYLEEHQGERVTDSGDQ